MDPGELFKDFKKPHTWEDDVFGAAAEDRL